MMIVLAFVLLRFAGCVPMELFLDTSSEISFTADEVEVAEFVIRSVPEIPEGKFLYFITTPVSGDPDMSVSNSEFTWNSSHSSGLEVIRLRAGMPGVVEGEDYTIHVKSFGGGSAFTVLGYISDDSYYINLVDGEPQLSEVFHGNWTYFKYSCSKVGEITVTVSDVVGDSDLCINIGETRPRGFSNCWRKSYRIGSDIIVFNQTKNEETTYTIGVYGYSDDSLFNILIYHRDTIAVIPESFPIEGEMGERFEEIFFKYYLPVFVPKAEMLSFTVMRRSSTGDPDLYVSREDSPGGMHPTPFGESTWRSLNFGDEADTCRISDAAPHSEYYTEGWYYIGVFNYQQYVRYDLTITRSDGHVILQRGKKFKDAVGPNKYVYYMFHYVRPDDLLPGDPGQIDVFVEPYQYYDGMQLYTSRDEKYPDAQNYDTSYRTSLMGSITALHIEEPEDGWYYFSVSATDLAVYDITASISSKYSYISVGETISGSVESGKYKYYVVDLGFDIQNSVEIALSTTNVANADMYVAVGYDPKSYDNMWESEHSELDILIIDKEDEHLQPPDYQGQLTIGVYGESSERSYFTLLLSFDNRTVELKNGVPVPGNVVRDEKKNYKYFMSHYGRLTINLQIFDDDNFDDADLFVALDYHPDRHTYDYRSMKPGSRNDYVSFNADVGWWYVSVIGWSDSSTSYQISAAAENEYLSSHGRQYVDSVEKDTWRYYRSTISYEDLSNFFVGITLISGEVSIYAVNTTDHPDENNYLVMSDTFPQNFLQYSLEGKSKEVYSTWTIGVFGQDTSSYFIHATSPIEYIDYYHYQAQLKPSTPIVGKAFVNSGVQYFLFRTKAVKKDYRMIIRMMNRTATELDIFVDQDNIRPNATSKWSFQVKKTGFFYISADEVVEDSYFYFGVKAKVHDALFYISFSDVDDPIYLTQEYPLLFKTQANQELNFELFSDEFATGLNIVIDSCTERVPPQFYISTSGDIHPNETNYDLKSKKVHYYSQQYMNSSFVHRSYPYYFTTEKNDFAQTFTVYSFTRDDFRPILSQDEITFEKIDFSYHLEIPKATSSHFATLTYKIFSRVLEGDEQEGNINVYTPCSVASSSRFNLELVQVLDSNSGTFDVGLELEMHEKTAIVVIVETEHGHQSPYQPIFIYNGDLNTLNIGKAKFAKIDQGVSRVFTIDRLEGEAGKYLSFALTPFDGDVKMQAHCVDHPTVIYEAYSFHFDVIEVYLTEEMLGPWEVEIIGLSSAKFSLLAYVNDPNYHILLSDGSPQLMKTNAGDTSYYRFHLDDEDSIFFVGTTPLKGDPDVYVSSVLKNPNRDNCNNSICWKAMGISLDFVKIGNTDAKYVPFGTYYIGVRAYGSRNSTYTLVAVKEQTSEHLAAGIPYGRAVLAHDFIYFKFELAHDTDLSIVVSPLSVYGDPDIFVSKTVKNPNRRYGQYTWYSQKSGLDTLTISDGGKGWYYIGVYGYRYDTQFQITIQGTGNSTMLVSGVPMEIEGQEIGSYRFFRTFHDYEEIGIHISAQKSKGSVELYADKTNTHPKFETSEFSCFHEGAVSFIDIEPSEYIGYYYIGVLSNGAEKASYTITVENEQDASMLLDGELSTGHSVLAHKYKYFEFAIPLQLAGRGATVSILGTRGDPDLYVSCTVARPTKDASSHDWQSRMYSRDSVTVTGRDMEEKGCSGRLYIGVYGFSTAEFAILAFLENSTQVLYEDTPVPGYIERGYNEYKFDHIGSGTLFISLHMVDAWPADGDLYVSLYQDPSQLNFYWKSVNAFSDELITIENSVDTTYYIAVHAYTGPFEYVITVYSEYFEIVDGEQSQHSVDVQNEKCFKTELRYNADELIAAVTTINGETVLTANPNGTIPSFENGYRFFSDEIPNVLYLDMNDFESLEVFPSEWSFCVHAIRDSDFYFGISSDESGADLKTGTGRVSGVKDDSFSYFRYSQVKRDEESRYYVMLTSYGTISHPSCFSIYASQLSENPDENVEWKLEDQTKNLVILPLTGIQKGIDFSNLYVSVRACKGYANEKVKAFTLYVINDKEVAYLLHDKELIFEDNYLNAYGFKTSKHSEQIMLQLDSCFTTKTTKCKLSVFEHGNYIQSKVADHEYSALAQSVDFKSEQDYFVKVESLLGHNLVGYSLFVTTNGVDPRPALQNSKISKTLETEDGDRTNYKVYVTPADGSQDDLTYHLYYYELPKWVPEEEEIPDNINFYTSCALLYNENSKLFTEHSFIHRKKGNEDGLVFAAIELNNTLDYVVNILVEDTRLHLTSVYYPILIKHTKVPSTVPVGDDLVTTIIMVSVGGLLVLLGAIVLYFLVGCLIKVLFCNKKGLEAIPFYGLCVKICSPLTEVFAKKYDRFDDEEDEIELDDGIELDEDDEKIEKKKKVVVEDTIE